MVKQRAVQMLAATLLVALVMQATSIQAQQQGATNISGQVVNGTAGAGTTQEVEVLLDIYQANGQLQQQRTTKADEAGRFAFEDVPVLEGAAYNLTAAYLDIGYTLTLSPEEEWSNIRLEVYEATSSLETVFTGNNVMLVLGADPTKRTVAFLETLQVNNTGDRVFIPSIAQSNVMGLLRFPLPSGAFDLDIQTDLPQGQVLQVDRGFALTTPVPPGDHSVLLSYKVSYTKEPLDLSRSFLRGAGSFRLLVPKSAGTVSSRSMVDRGDTTIGTTRFRLLEATNLSPGATVDATLEGLPQPSLLQRIQQTFRVRSSAIVVPVALALLLAALLVVGIRRGGAPQPAMAANSRGRDRASLVQAIAALDDKFAGGDVEESSYQEQRRALKAHLLRLAWVEEEQQHRRGVSN